MRRNEIQRQKEIEEKWIDREILLQSQRNNLLLESKARQMNAEKCAKWRHQLDNQIKEHSNQKQLEQRLEDEKLRRELDATQAQIDETKALLAEGTAIDLLPMHPHFRHLLQKHRENN